jgi:CheY-like chemotaxis protein/HPt (histidine-containing phosphotransfer) domain-containing protein
MQILTNLIGNAIKFTPSGKDIKLTAHWESAIITFRVIDQGAGISVDHQKNIFKAFDRGDESTSQKFGGTGLGLTITKKLVDALAGEISVESQLGQGSIFSVSLPVKVSASVATPRAEEENKSNVFAKNSVILVVEDNFINQALIETLFAEIELKVNFANNGKLGVEKAIALSDAGRPPDIIFMDMQMPVMNGEEATKKIRLCAKTKDIPIIALSADAFSEQKEKVLSSGIDEYLTKPIEMDRLHSVLRKYLPMENKLSSHQDRSSQDLPISLNATPIIDMSVMSELDVNLQSRLISLFIEHTGLQVKDILTRYSENDLVGMIEATHHFKGSCLAIGASSLVAACIEIKEKIEEDYFSNLPSTLINLENIHKQTIIELKLIKES